MKRFLMFVMYTLFLPALVNATSLININTADATLLETLPDVGPVIAGRIITYRETNGPFVTIEDLQNVKGIGSGVTYAKIAPLITVGTSGDTPSATTTTLSSIASSATTTTPTNTGGGGTPEYLPIPTLRLVVNGGRSVAVLADTAFTVIVYDEKARKRSDAIITWSFGDGMSRTGSNVLHAFYEPGEYNVVVEATTDDGGITSASFVVAAKKTGVSISTVSPSSISLTNTDTVEADISYWQLVAGTEVFKFPPRTKILGKHTVAFASQVTKLAPVGSAILKYPNGDLAAMYPSNKTTVELQPSPISMGYNSVQKVEPEQKTTIEKTHDVEAVRAPIASTTVAAVGAAMLPISIASSRNDEVPLLWILGFIGIVLVSGAALFLKQQKD